MRSSSTAAATSAGDPLPTFCGLVALGRRDLADAVDGGLAVASRRVQLRQGVGGRLGQLARRADEEGRAQRRRRQRGCSDPGERRCRPRRARRIRPARRGTRGDAWRVPRRRRPRPGRGRRPAWCCASRPAGSRAAPPGRRRRRRSRSRRSPPSSRPRARRRRRAARRRRPRRRRPRRPGRRPPRPGARSGRCAGRRNLPGAGFLAAGFFAAPPSSPRGGLGGRRLGLGRGLLGGGHLLRLLVRGLLPQVVPDPVGHAFRWGCGGARTTKLREGTLRPRIA